MATFNNNDNQSDNNFLLQLKNRSMTIVTVGKTGKGKSSTLNSLLMLLQQNNPNAEVKHFRSDEGPNSVSSEVTWIEFIPEVPIRLAHKSGIVTTGPPAMCPCDDGPSEEVPVLLTHRSGIVTAPSITCPPIRLVDTIGLFDTKLTTAEKVGLDIEKMSCVDKEHELVLQQFIKVMEMCKEGIDAFLFVLKATDRATAEELETVNIIFRYLGWNMLDYVIFVITAKDEARLASYEGWRNHICDFLDKKGYPKKSVEDRFIFVDNKNPTKEQAEDIFSLVQYVNDMNSGKPYTLVAFDLAQANLEKEKQRIKDKLQKEMQGKIDEKIKPIKEKHQIEISNLDIQIAKAVDEASKLRADQEAQRQQHEANIAQMKQQQEDERRRLEEATRGEVARLEEQQRLAYEQERIRMTAQIEQMKVQIQEQHNRMQAAIQQAQSRRRRRGCIIL